MKSNILYAAFLFLFAFTANAFAQGGNAQLGGVVQDKSKALIPGVTITAKNVDTGVSATQLTNDSGIYNFPVLQPGTYEISSDLQGFKKSIQKADLPYAGQVRVNFTLEIGTAADVVNVTVSTESLLKESSASVGDVLSRDRIDNLPLVGNNVLDLLETLPGLRSSPVNDSFDTVNGMGIDTINVTRDGLSINDGRYAAGSTTGGSAIAGKGRYLLSDTTLLPDLVGEVRLILSPVDAELGRGNSQIQIRTRSGTNKYTGSAAWYIRNTALDANSWSNNHQPFTDSATGVTTNSTQKPWRNNHQYSVAYGGPIKIPGVYDGKNKTFFYSLWSQNISHTRQVVFTPVLTDTARQGIFRYYPGFAPMGFNVNTTIPNQKLPVTASTASWVSVDLQGNPVAPPGDPTGTLPAPKLTCFSIFGNRRLDTNGNMVPFTAADCPNGTAVFPSAASGLWDANRPTADTTGYIRRLLAQMPHANYFGALDGLNLAQYAYLQNRGGSQGTGVQQITDPNANSKQINIKIDHNFNSQHKAAFNYTYQRDDSAANISSWPGAPSGSVVRRPHVFTVNVTSTLSPTMVNEARFGLNRNYNLTIPAYLDQDGSASKAGEDFLLPGGPSSLNPSYNYLVTVSSAVGRAGSGSGPLNLGLVSWTNSMLYSYGDTLSWTKNKHAFKFGAELRLPRNEGNGGANPFPGVTLGNNGGATLTVSPFGNTITELTGLQASSLIGGANPRADATSLLYLLSGSVSTASQFYFIKNFTNLDTNRWDDVSTTGIRMKRQVLQEWSAFAKDDYKITRNLTLNLGVRWEYYASPYIQGGLTSTIIDSGYGSFGATRTAQATLDQFNNDPFAYWLRPGNLYLTGYGTNPFTAGLLPEDCKPGIQQHPLLPKSTCDPNSLSSIQFIGPDSPNPKLKAVPEQKYNFGPAIGFAYELPFFGEGKTTIRGGYQQTFQRLLVNNSGEANGTDTFIGQIPGSQNTFNTTIADQVYQNIINPAPGTPTRALTLSDLALIVPVRPTLNPGGVYPLGSRGQGINGIYDSKYKGPYTQNVNLSVTRQISRSLTVDVRYTGTLGRRIDSAVNLNTPNIYHNPELLQALLDARAGTCTANSPAYQSYTSAGISPCDVNNDPVLLDQMMAGLNLNSTLTANLTTPQFGAVGTNVLQPANTLLAGQTIYQTGAAHLRRSTTFQGSLANGDFNAVAGNLVTLIPSGLQTLPTDPSTGQPYYPTTNHPTPLLRAVRNGCDRIANGFTMVQQTAAGGAQVANSGAPIPLRCFAEDYLVSNSQFTNITYHSNFNNSYYHSMQAHLSARPIQGISIDSTLVWSKTMGLIGTFIDPANRDLNYGAQASSPLALRMNGTVELPIGPNKLLLGNSSGWLARAIERWQTSFIFNANSANRATSNPGTNHFYGNPGWDVASPNWTLPTPDFQWSGNSGSLFGNQYAGAPDPQCTDPTQVTSGDKMGTNLQATNVCTLTALARRNADGTPGEVLLKATKPGQVGNLGFNNFTTFGSWTLDVGASKTFRVNESKSILVRIDTSNVLNHPTPGIPSFNVGTFGTTTSKNGERTLQGQLRINF